MRPAELVGRKQENCHLPVEGWGLLLLSVARLSAGKAWADNGKTHDKRVSYSATKGTSVPAKPPELNEDPQGPDAQQESLLAKRPYDLRHAGISSGRHAIRAPAPIAERSGHSVEVLMTRYSWVLDDQDVSANKALEDAYKVYNPDASEG